MTLCAVHFVLSFLTGSHSVHAAEASSSTAESAVSQSMNTGEALSLPSAPGGPWVGTVRHLVGLQEIPEAPGGPGGTPPSGITRLNLKSDSTFCLVAEHREQDVLPGRLEAMVEQGTLPWRPAPAARQMMVASGRWESESSTPEGGMVLTGLLSWFPVFSPAQTGASIDDPPCEVMERYRESIPPTIGPLKFTETFIFSADPNHGPEAGGEITYLLVRTEQHRRLPYVGFRIP